MIIALTYPPDFDGEQYIHVESTPDKGAGHEYYRVEFTTARKGDESEREMLVRIANDILRQYRLLTIGKKNAPR